MARSDGNNAGGFVAMTANTNKAGRILKYVVLLVVVVNLAIVAVVFLGANSPQPRPMPNPNGYDDFVKAGQMVTGKPGDYNTMSKEELVALVATNQEVLRLVRIGLGRECRAPDYNSAQTLPLLASLKGLALLISAEGKLAELGGHSNEAAKIYIEGIRFGQKSSQGGVLIVRLVGLACEAIPTWRLEPLTNSLDAQTCREIAQALEAIDAGEEPAEETIKQEKLWSLKVFGLRAQFMALVQYKSNREYKKKFIQKVKANTLRRRQLILNFAARAFELEQGKRAQSTADLVPGYLKAIPQDPTTGTNLVLTP